VTESWRGECDEGLAAAEVQLLTESESREICTSAEGRLCPTLPRVCERAERDLESDPTLGERWISIAADQNLLPLTPEQRAELERCLDAYEASGRQSRPAQDVIAEIKKKI
jgi:hypothetical protein